MKRLKKQDRNGSRKPSDIERKYRLGEIELTKEEVEKLKTQLVVDSTLSASSSNAIANKAVTKALNDKVTKEEGKGLSSNDFTNDDKEKLNTATSNNHTHSNKNLLDTYKQTETNLADAVSKKHSHDNKTALDTYTKTQDELIGETTANSHSHSNKAVLDGITEDDIKAWDNLATYENGGTTDANTTTERLILTKVNAPTTDFWYIETLFYSSISNTSNRKQIAYSYKFDAPIYTRYFNGGVWSEWKSVLEETNKSYNLSSYKVSALTILRSCCIVKNKRVAINFTGTITMAANTTTELFNLPADLRPTQIKDFVVFAQNTNDDGYIGYGQISNTGSVQVRFNTAISSYIRFSTVYDLD